MAIEFFLPVIANMIQGAAASGMANAQAREDTRLARMRRAELQPLIDRLRKPTDFTGLEEGMLRDFSRASDQMAAESAMSGMTGAGRGGLDHRRSDMLGQIIAALAEARMTDDQQKQYMLAQLLSDPSMYEGERQGPSMGTSLFGGAMGGLGAILPAFLSTQEGLDILRGLIPQRTPQASPGMFDTSGMGAVRGLGGDPDVLFGPPPTTRPAAVNRGTNQPAFFDVN